MSGQVEWDAATYHRVSEPQLAWGLEVLARLELRGDETVLDAGCGTGRLTEALLARLPRGRVVALDRSRNMLAEARARLAPQHGDRVSFVEQDLLALSLDAPVDVVFSTATLHWVLDHDALFPRLRAALVPGGRLVAQCGGEGNLARVLRWTAESIAELGLEGRFAGWVYPTYFSPPGLARARMEAAGFADAEAWLTEAPTRFDGPEALAEFLRSVVLARMLEHLRDPAERARLLDAVVRRAGEATPRWELDYVRLWLTARRA